MESFLKHESIRLLNKAVEETKCNFTFCLLVSSVVNITLLTTRRVKTGNKERIKELYWCDSEFSRKVFFFNFREGEHQWRFRISVSLLTFIIKVNTCACSFCFSYFFKCFFLQKWFAVVPQFHFAPIMNIIMINHHRFSTYLWN